LPPFAVEQLNLSDQQQKQVQALEDETRQKLEKILTAEQVEAMKAARPQRGGRGGIGGGSPPPAGMHVIPPFAEGKLNLTDVQKVQVAELVKEVKGKLAKVLSAEQMKMLEEARPPAGGPRGGGTNENR
jgi:Spy/CpxP family protein refolding chaperone